MATTPLKQGTAQGWLYARRPWYQAVNSACWSGISSGAWTSRRRRPLSKWVTYIGIDVTGLGSGVAQLVRQFFPNVTTFSYSPEVKTRLVLKAYDVIHKGRLEFDAGWTDLAQSLMAIRKTVTTGGRQYTYTAGRNDTTGHADLAWALFHALHNEPLEGQTTANTGRMKIF